MAEYYKEILAFLAFCLALYGWFTKFHEANTKASELTKVKEENKELKKKWQSSSMDIDLSNLNAAHEVVKSDVFLRTIIDRFLLLSGVNGKEAFNFVSALYEQHKDINSARLSVGATSKYVDIKTDDHYKQMLKQSESIGPVFGNVSEMESCKLKEIYESEGVKCYAIFFIERQILDNDNDRLVYISFASHESGVLSNFTKIQLESAANKIKKLLI